MSLRDSPLETLRAPLAWTAGVALAVAALAAAGVLMSQRGGAERIEAEAYSLPRRVADDTVKPVAGVLAAPVRWAGQVFAGTGNYFAAGSQNAELKRQLQELRRIRAESAALRTENTRLRQVLGLKLDPPIPMVAAHVVAESRGPFARKRLIDVGAEKGVVIGNPVMTERGLVGRVVGVAAGASRVLLLTDPASKAPVMIERNNARAILSGDGGGNPRLEFARSRDPIREGDRVMTSGDGGVLPRGLPVGVAAKGLDGVWRVRLDSDEGPIDVVRVLLFRDFAQLADAASLNGAGMPPVTTPDQDRSILGAAAVTPPGAVGAPVVQGPASAANAAAVAAGAAVAAATRPATIEPPSASTPSVRVVTPQAPPRPRPQPARPRPQAQAAPAPKAAAAPPPPRPSETVIPY